MVELFGIYALLLAGWGVYSHHRSAAAAEEAATAASAALAPEPAIHVRRIERGSAARQHVGTTSGV